MNLYTKIHQHPRNYGNILYTMSYRFFIINSTTNRNQDTCHHYMEILLRCVKHGSPCYGSDCNPGPCLLFPHLGNHEIKPIGVFHTDPPKSMLQTFKNATGWFYKLGVLLVGSLTKTLPKTSKQSPKGLYVAYFHEGAAIWGPYKSPRVGKLPFQVSHKGLNQTKGR